MGESMNINGYFFNRNKKISPEQAVKWILPVNRLTWPEITKPSGGVGLLGGGVGRVGRRQHWANV